MIELTEAQTQAISAATELPVAVNPRTGEEYLIIRRDVYEKMRRFLNPEVDCHAEH